MPTYSVCLVQLASHLEAPDSSRLGSDIQSRDLTEHVVLPVAKSVPVPPPLSARSRRRIHRKMVEREILKRKQHESRAAQGNIPLLYFSPFFLGFVSLCYFLFPHPLTYFSHFWKFLRPPPLS